MPRYIAFLRGINVGGHRVKMDELRRHFETLKFARVETFIASGNVVYETAASDTAALESRIEKHLARVLGYEAATFVRTLPELSAVAAFTPFPKIGPDDSLYVHFLKTAPDAALEGAIAALRTAVDDFRVHGREVYWLCRGKISEVSLAWPLLDKLMKKCPATARNFNTVQKMAAQFCATDS